MGNQQKFRGLLTRSGATLLPVAHDCLTAKLVERAGFEAVATGGFATAGVFYGLPDVGLIGLSEMVEAVRKIAAATNLPVFADADGGYGNERNVAYTVRQYEAAGVASLFIEDQKHPKRCGHTDGKELISVEEMIGKIKAALAARSGPDFAVCARTDAIAVEGFTAAITRAKQYRDAGADIIFVEAPVDITQLKEIPRQITGGPLLVNMLDGGKTPILSKNDLEKMGYKLIAYPVTTLFSGLKAAAEALRYLKTNGSTLGWEKNMIGFAEYKDLVELEKYD